MHLIVVKVRYLINYLDTCTLPSPRRSTPPTRTNHVGNLERVIPTRKGVNVEEHGAEFNDTSVIGESTVNKLISCLRDPHEGKDVYLYSQNRTATDLTRILDPPLKN